MTVEPADQDTSIEALEQELGRIKAELENYQALIEDLPSIYEGKFRYHLSDVARDIRRLLDERHALQEQIEHALQGSQPEQALPPIAAPPEAEPVPHSGASLRLILLSAVTALAVAVLVAALGISIRSRSTRPAPAAAPAAPEAQPEPAAAAPSAPAESPNAAAPRAGSLRLRARGPCWVDVRSLEGRRLFMDTLQPGEERSLALGDGLQLLAGRPDLLEVAIGTGECRTLGAIEQVRWTTLRPQAPAQPSS
ncbi:MAG: DUF4115 domain-containing protein [Cyanobacteria bacterium J06638_7]